MHHCAALRPDRSGRASWGGNLCRLRGKGPAQPPKHAECPALMLSTLVRVCWCCMDENTGQRRHRARRPEYGGCPQGHGHKEGSHYRWGRGNAVGLQVDTQLLPTWSSRSCNKPQETNQQNIHQREWIRKWPAAPALNQGGLCGSCEQLGKERDSKCSLRAGRPQLSALLDQALGLASRVTGLTWAKGQPIFLNKCMHFILTTAFLHRRLLLPSCLCPLLTRLGDTVDPRCFLGTEGRSTPLCLCTSCSLPRASPTSVILGFVHILPVVLHV